LELAPKTGMFDVRAMESLAKELGVNFKRMPTLRKLLSKIKQL
jgi:hypothetical protein